MESNKRMLAMNDIDRLYEQCLEHGDGIIRNLGDIGLFRGIFMKDGYNLEEIMVWRKHMHEGFQALKRAIK